MIKHVNINNVVSVVELTSCLVFIHCDVFPSLSLFLSVCIATLLTLIPYVLMCSFFREYWILLSIPFHSFSLHLPTYLSFVWCICLTLTFQFISVSLFRWRFKNSTYFITEMLLLSFIIRDNTVSYFLSCSIRQMATLRPHIDDCLECLDVLLLCIPLENDNDFTTTTPTTIATAKCNHEKRRRNSSINETNLFDAFLKLPY